MSRRPKGVPSRRRPTRDLREIILIVCEGAKTEPLYFNKLKSAFRLPSLNVHCEILGGSPGHSPKKIVEVAIQKKAKRCQNEIPYDQVYCVMDIEIPPRGLDDLIRLSDENEIRLIFSNPCFEYWYLLHFTKSNRSFNTNRQLIAELKSHIPNYDKVSTVFLSEIYDLTNTAIQNAKELASANGWASIDLRDHNSSTRVHEVVEHLKNMSTA